MSFDVYFVPRPDDGDWDAAMIALEEAAEGGPQELGDALLAQWNDIVRAAVSELPGVEDHVTESFCELTDEHMGVQLSMSAGELSLSAAYWSDGDEAMETVAKLRRLASHVERITGLTAYDPQSGGAFLESEPGIAGASFDAARTLLDNTSRERAPARRRRWPFSRN